MSGESTFPDNQLHIGRAASPHLTSRRSTLSSRTGSSRPSSRSGSEAGGHHPPSFGLGVNAFSGLSSYSKGGSVGRAAGTRSSSSTRGLQAAAYHRRRHWTVAEGSQASNGAGVHAMPGQVPRGATASFVNERSYSHPA
ncbi:hypothetical protein [Sporisorium scitamineum]|uniref:Uncharacterized protein n=1 Tax=Sporisorium scitamineum TaxID=49012 RepID=A0A0F7RV66_9BASI|nr:hypothetical protein [Sporisorium scitamineum]